jgi:tetratricopeptide (TPR) repeat protein
LILALQGCGSLDMCLAVSAYGNKDYLEAREITARVIKDNPNLPLALTLHGWSQFQLGELNIALSDFKKIQAEYPDNFHGYLGEAWVLIQRGKLEQAEKLLDQAELWMNQHQRTMLRVTRGWVAFYRDDLVEAERQFLQAEEVLFLKDRSDLRIESNILASQSTMPWVGMGWVKTIGGNTAGAVKAFKKGLSRDSSCHFCYAGLAHISEKDGKIDRAIHYAEAGLLVSRYDPELVAQLNRLLQKKNSPIKSREVYTRLVKKSRDNPLYLASLGHIYLSQNDPEQAEKLFLKALAIDPHHELATSGLSRLKNQAAF